MTDLSPDAVERPAYLIRKHGGYYKPNSNGYTDSEILAGRYTLAEADSITHPNGQDGPRDGMTYIHENKLADPSWLAYAALSSQLEAANQRAKTLERLLLEARQWNWLDWYDDEKAMDDSELIYPKLWELDRKIDAALSTDTKGG